MSRSEASILKELRLESVEKGKYIYVYRIHKGEFTIEKCLANVAVYIFDEDDSRATVNKAGRFDENGKLFDVYTIDRYSGAVYSRGGCDLVWFTKANKRKAKKALRDFYKERITYYEDMVNRTNEKLELVK